MPDNLAQYIENRGRVSKGSESEKVLGSNEGVLALADVWQRHAGLFHLIGADGLLKYCEVQSFNSEQLSAFKMGLAVIPGFMRQCHDEMTAQKKEIDGKKNL